MQNSDTGHRSAPSLRTSLGPSLSLPAPVVAAAGTFGYGEESQDLVDLSRFGAVITPTLTLLPRDGNAPPRTAEASAGLVHSVGLPNPGLERFVSETLPIMRDLPCPAIISIVADSPQEWSSLARALDAAGGIAAVELNLQPLSLLLAELSSREAPAETEILANIECAVAAVRAATTLPVIAKLPSVGAEVGRAAGIAVGAGADVIAVSQAFPAVVVRASERKFRFPGTIGGLSGPCIKPLALYQVWRVAQVVSAPILGSGGIMNGEDAVEFLLAGASAVAVGTASFVHPDAAPRISAEIADYLARRELASPADLVGGAKR